MGQSTQKNSLSKESLLEGVSHLCKVDPDLSDIINNLGNPPLWSREPGFASMIHIILEQQVSLASAKAAYTKLEQAAGKLTPERFLEFTDDDLKKFGFSRQKAKYGRTLSHSVLSGTLVFDDLNGLDDKTVRGKLMEVKGIGPWTADIYLLMALLRPDVWPSGDLALAKAAQKIKNLAEIPSPEKLNEIAERWKPWRAVAARILWHYYLN